MQIYKAPLEDMRFLLEALGYDEVASLERYEDYDLETVMAILEENGKFCTNEMLPLNRSGDVEGVKYNPEDHSVTTPRGFKELYEKFSEAGMLSLSQDPEYGGGGAPYLVGMVISEMATATNKSFTMCPGLTHGLIDALLHHGSDEQKQAYLPNLISGKWTGTMCLTEPQCGTDLGLIKTKAVVAPDGDGYLLTGTKIWITFGEHDMAENIVHLVLARLPDAPEGIKGISLFVVPKFTLDGQRNPIFCGGLEHKMGIHASPTCVMNLEDARGWLVGEPHKGMRGMFTMMNMARLGVGMEGVALSEISYQTALAFAKDRRQSRSLNPERQDPNASADNILVHPDVRRMLLNVRATNEAMRALGYFVGKHHDLSLYHKDEQVREESDDLVALLTPIIKSFFTERGFLNVSDALQLMGGAGYTQDWSVEQYLRDLRIAMLYEGTNHIQALDLVGRKLPRNMGRSFMKFTSLITDFIRENKENEVMAEFIGPLKETSKKLNQVTMSLGETAMADPELVGAVASNYLNLFGYTAMAYMWCLQLTHAIQRGDKFSQTKIKTARFFFRNILPEVDAIVQFISAGKDALMDFGADEL
ncbi:MAG: acyl-CoA dehydrogenase C-terminal domain-containing protein [Myxococcales bacterium]|nr:acyl-CoA dehydrogenase C-terminal domain-containing protein [Myxococcales bacterium]MCB9644022.1 acyl-CoA dehydrogenase C-terminal domain-containing protein [Myxococcales bacterium]